MSEQNKWQEPDVYQTTPDAWGSNGPNQVIQFDEKREALVQHLHRRDTEVSFRRNIIAAQALKG